MSDNIEYVEGLYVKELHENTPGYVKAKFSIKRKELGNWLRSKDDEYINVEIKVSKSGNWFAAVDTWEPEKRKKESKPTASNNGFDSEIPF